MWKLLLLQLHLLLPLSLLFGQPNAEIQVHAEQMPYFLGCEEYENGSIEKRNCSNRLLVSFIAQHLLYPDSARNQGVEGTVLVSFVINQEGEVQNPSLLRDIGGNCGEAALDVIRQMPPWQPASEGGELVTVKLNLPIQFNLKDDYEELAGGYNISWGRLQGQQVSREALLNNLDATILVRDPFGNDVPISELIFSFERKRKYLERKSNGAITRDMSKVVRKAKKGGFFTIRASVQKDGKFLFVDKAYEVID